MGTPEDLATCRSQGLAYCDKASRSLEQSLGHPPDLEELASFYGAAVGGMQGAMTALLQEMSGIDDVRAWFEYVAKITEEIARKKKAPLTIHAAVVDQDGVPTPVAAAPTAAAPAEDPLLVNNGHAVPTGTIPSDIDPNSTSAVEMIVCGCFNKSGICVVCLEGLVGRLVKAGDWISRVQELSGALEAECPACTPRILDRAVATAIKRTIDLVRPENRRPILSAVISALPQLTGRDEWNETWKMADRVTAVSEESKSTQE